MRDLRDAKPGEVYRDQDGDVWGVTFDGRAVPVFLAGGYTNAGARGFDRDDHAIADYGPFVLLTPEEDSEW
jgi:hypothetical protein